MKLIYDMTTSKPKNRWAALTLAWERPIQPELPPRVGRPQLLSPEVRKVIYDLDVIAQTAQNEIRRVFADRGLNSAQHGPQMRSIRRERG